MPRGSGRPGFGKRKVSIPGQDRDIKADYAPSRLFPKNSLLVSPTVLTPTEKLTLTYYKKIKTEIREHTPYYVTEVQDEGDINDGIRRYSDRYLPKQSEHIKYAQTDTDLSLFPRELRNIIDPSKKNEKIRVVKRKIDSTFFVDNETRDNVGDVEEKGSSAASSDVGDEQIDDDNFENLESQFDNGEEDDYGDVGEDDEAIM